MCRRAEHGAGHRERLRIEQPGEAEVHQLHLPVARHHDVVGFDVAVDDARLVRHAEGARDLERDHGADFRPQELALFDELAKRGPVDQLGGDVLDRRGGAGEAVDVDDVGVLKLRGGAGLTDEALAVVGRARDVLVQDLERDLPLQARVARSVDRGHPAVPELVEELVVVDALHAAQVAPRGAGRRLELERLVFARAHVVVGHDPGFDRVAVGGGVLARQVLGVARQRWAPRCVSCSVPAFGNRRACAAVSHTMLRPVVNQWPCFNDPSPLSC